MTSVAEKRTTFDAALKKVQLAHDEMVANPNTISRTAWLDSLAELRAAHDAAIEERRSRWPR